MMLGAHPMWMASGGKSPPPISGSWSEVLTLPTRCRRLYFDGTYIFAPCDGTNGIYRSSDGITFANVGALSGVGNYYVQISRAPDGSLVSAGRSASGTAYAILKSIDNGTTWSSLTSIAHGIGNPYRLIKKDSRMILVGDGSGTNQVPVHTSDDSGSTWTYRGISSPSSPATISTDIVWESGRFIMSTAEYTTSERARIFYSTDATSWTESTSISGGELQAVSSNGSISLAGGNAISNRKATAGTNTWSSTSFYPSGAVATNSITHNPTSGLFISAGSKISMSYDGESWTEVSAGIPAGFSVNSAIETSIGTFASVLTSGVHKIYKFVPS